MNAKNNGKKSKKLDKIYDDEEARENRNESNKNEQDNKCEKAWSYIKTALFHIWDKVISSILIVFVIVIDYEYLIVREKMNDNWVANLIIGIFQLLFFIILFPSIKKVFRDITSALVKR